MTPSKSRSAVWILSVLALLIAATSSADDDRPSRGRSFFSCDRDYSSGAERLRSPASMDLYHGLTYFAGTGVLRFATEPSRRWSAVNRFDDEARSVFSRSSSDGRESVDLASDILLGMSIAALPVASLISKHHRTRDCIETYDMATDIVESAGLTVFLTEAIKVASGRKRPISRTCDGTPPSDADCGNSDNERSFVSGHASMAAAGAGLTCAFAIKRDAWGSSTSARATPCLLSAATALTTGLLRISADRHWATDVIAGFTLGGLVGYFDTWGPFDLLRFETRNAKGQVSSRGVVLPAAIEGQLGAQVMLVF